MHCKSYSHFFSKKFQRICISLDVNFNESLTNDVVGFEQLGPGRSESLLGKKSEGTFSQAAAQINTELKYHTRPKYCTVCSGPSCSKLTMSLVNDSLKFTLSDTQIC